jgi:hypothetical protein
VDQNWPNDPRIGCKSPSSLVDFIESDLNLEEELNKLLKGTKLWSCKFSIIVFQISMYFKVKFILIDKEN